MSGNHGKQLGFFSHFTLHQAALAHLLWQEWISGSNWAEPDCTCKTLALVRHSGSVGVAVGPGSGVAGGIAVVAVADGAVGLLLGTHGPVRGG